VIAAFLNHQKHRVLATLCIIGMVLLLNLQLVVHLPSHFIGRPFDDAISVVWEFWWANEAVQEGKPVLYTPDVYYPNGYHLGSDAQPIWWMIVCVPLTRVFGPLAAYNIVTLTTLIVAGVGVYLLVEFLTGSRLAGVVASPVYIFAPVMTLRLGGHLNILLAAQWLPYLALFAYRSLANAGRHGWVSSALAGVMYFLASISCWYFAFIGFVPLISVFLLSSLERSKTRRLQRLGVALASWCLLTTPFLILTLQANSAMFGETAGFDLASSDGLSISVDRLLTPNPANAVWREWLSQRLDISGESDYISLGYVPLLLALLGMWKSKATRESKISAVAILSLSIILAMGTTLHWNHQRVLVGSPSSLAKLYSRLTEWLTVSITAEPAIPLPGLLLARFVPFYAMMRAWARFMIVGMLGLAILVGHGASFALSVSKRHGRYWMTFAAALILVEAVAMPYSEFTPIQMIQRPVDFWLAEQPKGIAIVEYPWPYRNKNALYSQTIHEQPIVNGYAPHVPLHLQQSPEVMSTWPNEATVATLREWGVEYILVTGADTQEFREVWADLQALPDLHWVESFPSVAGEAGVQVHVFEIADD
jgi:hypothetical protein